MVRFIMFLRANLLWLILCAFLFLAGYLTNRFTCGRSKHPLGGDIIRLRGRYMLSIWYHDTGEIGGVVLKDIESERALFENFMSAEGYTESYSLRLPQKYVFVVLDPSGTPSTRKYYTLDGKFYCQEYLDKAGAIVKVEEFPDPDPLAFIRDLDANEVRTHLQMVGFEMPESMDLNEAKVKFLKEGGLGWYVFKLGVDANNIGDPNYVRNAMKQNIAEKSKSK